MHPTPSRPSPVHSYYLTLKIVTSHYLDHDVAQVDIDSVSLVWYNGGVS